MMDMKRFFCMSWCFGKSMTSTELWRRWTAFSVENPFLIWNSRAELFSTQLRCGVLNTELKLIRLNMNLATYRDLKKKMDHSGTYIDVRQYSNDVTKYCPIMGKYVIKYAAQTRSKAAHSWEAKDSLLLLNIRVNKVFGNLWLYNITLVMSLPLREDRHYAKPQKSLLKNVFYEFVHVSNAAVLLVSYSNMIQAGRKSTTFSFLIVCLNLQLFYSLHLGSQTVLQCFNRNCSSKWSPSATTWWQCKTKATKCLIRWISHPQLLQVDFHSILKWSETNDCLEGRKSD